MSKTLSDVIFLADSAVAPEHLRPEPERILEGQPDQTLWNHYSDPSQQFHVGLWACEPGKWQVKYTEHEYCHILEGCVRMTDRDGQWTELKAGDHFVIPAGFEGTWEVIEPTRKIYVLFEAKT